MLACKSLAVLALPLLAVANPLVVRNDPPTVCNSGSINCCNQVLNATDPVASGLLGEVGVLVGAVVGALVGVGCSPITVIGTGHSGCKQETVCCTGNTFSNNLISLGCSPIIISL